MKNFVFGVVLGIVIAVCGYKPYQIEMEFRRNIAAGLGTPAPARFCVTTVRSEHL
jgi:hypothetical protein